MSEEARQRAQRVFDQQQREAELERQRRAGFPDEEAEDTPSEDEDDEARTARAIRRRLYGLGLHNYRAVTGQIEETIGEYLTPAVNDAVSDVADILRQYGVALEGDQDAQQDAGAQSHERLARIDEILGRIVRTAIEDIPDRLAREVFFVEPAAAAVGRAGTPPGEDFGAAGQANGNDDDLDDLLLDTPRPERRRGPWEPEQGDGGGNTEQEKLLDAEEEDETDDDHGQTSDHEGSDETDDDDPSDGSDDSAPGQGASGGQGGDAKGASGEGEDSVGGSGYGDSDDQDPDSDAEIEEEEDDDEEGAEESEPEGCPHHIGLEALYPPPRLGNPNGDLPDDEEDELFSPQSEQQADVNFSEPAISPGSDEGIRLPPSAVAVGDHGRRATRLQVRSDGHVVHRVPSEAELDARRDRRRAQKAKDENEEDEKEVDEEEEEDDTESCDMSGCPAEGIELPERRPCISNLECGKTAHLSCVKRHYKNKSRVNWICDECLESEEEEEEEEDQSCHISGCPAPPKTLKELKECSKKCGKTAHLACVKRKYNNNRRVNWTCDPCAAASPTKSGRGGKRRAESPDVDKAGPSKKRARRG